MSASCPPVVGAKPLIVRRSVANKDKIDRVIGPWTADNVEEILKKILV